MEAIKLLDRTIDFVRDFRGCYDNSFGATDFIDEYLDNLRHGAVGINDLAEDDQRKLMDKALEIAGIIRDEVAMAPNASGAALKGAILDRLIKDLCRAKWG